MLSKKIAIFSLMIALAGHFAWADPSPDNSISQAYQKLANSFNSTWSFINKDAGAQAIKELANAVSTKNANAELTEDLQDNIRDLAKQVITYNQENIYGREIPLNVLYLFNYDSNEHMQNDYLSAAKIFKAIGKPEDLAFIYKQIGNLKPSSEINRNLYSAMFSIIAKNPRDQNSKNYLWVLLNSLKYNDAMNIGKNDILNSFVEYSDVLLKQYQKNNDQSLSGLIAHVLVINEQVNKLQKELIERETIRSEQVNNKELSGMMSVIMSLNPGSVNDFIGKGGDAYQQHEAQKNQISSKNIRIKELQQELQKSIQSIGNLESAD